MVHKKDQSSTDKVGLMSRHYRAAIRVGFWLLTRSHERNTPEVEVAQCGGAEVGLLYLLTGPVVFFGRVQPLDEESGRTILSLHERMASRGILLNGPAKVSCLTKSTLEACL